MEREKRRNFNSDDLAPLDYVELRKYGSAIGNSDNGINGKSNVDVIKAEMLKHKWISMDEVEELMKKKKKISNVASSRKSKANAKNPSNVKTNDPDTRRLLLEQFAAFIETFSTNAPNLEMDALSGQFVKHKPKFDKVKDEPQRLQFFVEQSVALLEVIDRVIGRQTYISDENSSLPIEIHFQILVAVSRSVRLALNQGDCLCIDAGLVEDVERLVLQKGRPVFYVDGTIFILGRYFAKLNPLNRDIDLSVEQLDYNLKIEASHTCVNRLRILPAHLIYEMRAYNLARELCSIRCICLCRCVPKCKHQINGIVVICKEHLTGCPMYPVVRECLLLLIDRVSDTTIQAFETAIQPLIQLFIL